jgi:hypothetical protein
MTTVATNLYVLGMAVTFFLLAPQAEPVTGFLGYTFGGVLVLALVIHTLRHAKGGEDA